MNSIKEHLNDFGFFKYQQAILDLKENLKEEASLAGLSSKSILALPSYIPASEPKSIKDNILVIDIGGTSTKAALRKVKDNKISWEFLFEIKNLELTNLKSDSHSFQVFCDILADILKKTLRSLGLLSKEKFLLGIVWSNRFSSYPIKNLGIGGKVEGRNAYSKGEWFVRDLKDGEDLSNYFLNAFAKEKINITKFLIANDTCLTLKAGKCADSGMVVSTGMNATILKTTDELNLKDDLNELIICNSEIGINCLVKEAIGTSCDFLNFNLPASTLENFCSGLFLPKLLVGAIFAINKNGFKKFDDLVAHLNDATDPFLEFRAKDLSLLITSDPLFVDRRNKPEFYNLELINYLQSLAEEIVIRSAWLSALAGFASIANILDSKNNFNISLDSRLSREIPLFWNTLNLAIKEISPEDKLIKFNLILPIQTIKGNISVPLIGLANSLDCL